MNGLNHQQRHRNMYDEVFRRCLSLNMELHKLAPLARQMHLLSANAVCSAARAGSEGDAFRVLTQDIQLLGVDVSESIEKTQHIINEIVMMASTLSKHLASLMSYNATLARAEDDHAKANLTLIRQQVQVLQTEIHQLDNTLAKRVRELTNQLMPLKQLVNKGEYLAVYSSVEAAHSGAYGKSFIAVANMLRDLITQLSSQSSSQLRLLDDLAESVESLSNFERNHLYES